MRIPTGISALAVAAALVILAGCSGGSAIAPKPATPQDHSRRMMSRVPVALGSNALRTVHLSRNHHYKSFDTCPCTGAIEYISDFNNNVINIYKGKFAGQSPCGQLAPVAVLNPQGMVVDRQHNLYIADTGNGNVLAFHRGATSPFQTYADTTNGSQFPIDVAVSDDGVVFATNIYSPNTGIGSISAFNQSTGALIGNYPNPNAKYDYFVTVQKDGTMYWDDNGPTLWTGNCALGICGAFTATVGPAGVLKSADHEDVVILHQGHSGGEVLTTYEPPNFSSGVSCKLTTNVNIVSFDIDKHDKHIFYVDSTNGGVEVTYPSCKAVGKILPPDPAPLFLGIAVDPAGPLQ